MTGQSRLLFSAARQHPPKPAEWMAARLPRLEAEDALAISHFQGKENLLKRLQALKQADFSRRASAIACPTLIISAADDLLVPASCSRVLQTAIPGRAIQGAGNGIKQPSAG